MKTITHTEKVTIKVSKEELLEGKWLAYTLLSAKIAEIEKKENLGYKSYRTKLYNSYAGNKYNVEIKAGIKCINVDEPMKSTASLALEFIKE